MRGDKVQPLQARDHDTDGSPDRVTEPRTGLEAGEDRCGHQHTHEVLPPPRLEGDRVGQRIGKHQRHHGSAGGVRQRPQERSTVVRERVDVVLERPGHRIPGVQRAVRVVQRGGAQLDRRHREEKQQPEHPGKQQVVAGKRSASTRRWRSVARGHRAGEAYPAARGRSGLGHAHDSTSATSWAYVSSPACASSSASSRNVWAGAQCMSTSIPTANAWRAPLFCSNTVSSWPHGIRTRYWVLTPMKLTSLTTPPARRLLPSRGSLSAAARKTFSGRTPTHTVPWGRGARAAGADSLLP